MKITKAVKTILSNYESDNPGTKANLARILMQGQLGGTGKLIILPVDQGFEHGPARSFAINEPAYDPHYHYQLAIDAGLSAYAAPLGMLEAGADTVCLTDELSLAEGGEAAFRLNLHHLASQPARWREGRLFPQLQPRP